MKKALLVSGAVSPRKTCSWLAGSVDFHLDIAGFPAPVVQGEEDDLLMFGHSTDQTVKVIDPGYGTLVDSQDKIPHFKTHLAERSLWINPLNGHTLR